jgi:hypothetical protein
LSFPAGSGNEPPEFEENFTSESDVRLLSDDSRV